MGLPQTKRRTSATEKDFYKLLHPELRRRVSYLMEDLRERGWDPYIPEVFGIHGTGYRSVRDQADLKEKFPEQTGSGKSSFHIITGTDGSPEAMAVHITIPSIGSEPRRGQPFLEDLEVLAERHGLRTGNRWKKPWDPLHVQLYENEQKESVLKGARPSYLDPVRRFLPPSLGKRPWELTPKTPSQLEAGRFRLTPGFGWPPKPHTPPPITSKQFEAGNWMRLIPRPFGGARSEPPPWAKHPNQFRSSPPPGIGFRNLGLNPPGNFGRSSNYDALTRRLTPPTMSLFTASGGAFSGAPMSSRLNLGNFQLRPPSVGA